MYRKAICLLLCIISLTAIYLPLKVNAYNNLDEDNIYNIIINSNGEYSITQYKIDMLVNEDNSYEITEYIQVYYIVPQHGIVRNIPLRNKVERSDGSKVKSWSKISDVYVDTKFKETRNMKNIDIKIGDKETYVEGYKDYVISYTYDVGYYKEERFDELYFNLIGVEWDTYINNVEFQITMPKEFDESKLGFSSGKKGSTDSSSIVYEVKDNKVISGEYIGYLEPEEALTVRLELPKGYFNNEFTIETSAIWMAIIPIIFLLITFISWIRYRDDKVIETVEFYPPKGLNSAMVGLLYNGQADYKDVVSLLIHLANKGYIQIKETDTMSSKNSGKSFVITKLEDYYEDDYCEWEFMQGLFKDGRKTVRAEDLENNFYETSNEILGSLNSEGNRLTIFDKKSIKKEKWTIFFIIMTFILITSIPIITNRMHIISLIGILLFLTIGLTLSFTSYIIVSGREKLSKDDLKMILPSIFGEIVCYGGYIFMFLPILLTEPSFLIAYIVGLVCIIGMFILKKTMRKRTEFGNMTLGRIRGFKNFLETAEKDRLEELVMENPTYFYDILPYSYVLGVSDKWISKFENINMQGADWYHSSIPSAKFSTIIIYRLMNSTIDIANRVMTSNPSITAKELSASSSSGGSGKGLAGRGFGGGGGMSW